MDSKEQKALQKNLIQFLVGDVFNTITKDDIIQIRSLNVWEHRGRLLDPSEISLLREEAKLFHNSKLWRILLDEMRYLAQQAIGKSKTEEDLVAGKLLLYLVKEMNKKVTEIAKV